MSGKSQDRFADRGLDGNYTVEPELDLATMYATYSDFVHRTCRQLGVPASSAEDMVHDVFIVAHRRLPSVRQRGSIRSWLYGITRRLVMHYHRGELRTEQRMRLVAEPPPTPDPQQSLERQELGEEVAALLDRLEPRKREVLYLADAEGFAVREIADALGVNINTIYARLRAGRKAFATLLERHRRRNGRRA